MKIEDNISSNRSKSRGKNQIIEILAKFKSQILFKKLA